MQTLYNGSGFYVVLIGEITAMPIQLQQHGKSSIIVTITQPTNDSVTQQKKENYRVILEPEDASNLLQVGFPGMTISVLGNYCDENRSEIVAKQVNVVAFSSSAEMHLHHLNCEEKSYWFNYDGTPRNELFNIH